MHAHIMRHVHTNVHIHTYTSIQDVHIHTSIPHSHSSCTRVHYMSSLEMENEKMIEKKAIER